MPYTSAISDANIDRLTDKQEVIGKVTKEFAQSEMVLAAWKADIVTYYQLYSLVQKHKNYDVGMADIFVPEILRAVETVVAKLYQMLFSDDNWMEYCGRDNNGDDKNSIALTELTYYQMDENNFKARVMDSLRQMVITGLTVRKIGWDYQEVKRKLPNSLSRIDTIKDTWTFEPVDLLTFAISDITTPYNDLQKAEWIGEEYLVAENYVDRRTKMGWFSDKMEKDLDDAETAPEAQAQQHQRNRFQSSGFVEQPNKDKVLIQERWGLCPASWIYSPEELKKEGYDAEDMCESVIVIANKCAILKLEPNPWFHQQKPYVACPYIAKEGELPGMGAAKVGRSLQEEINDTRNQTLDNKTLILSTMWLKSSTSGIKDKDLIIRPNGVITTHDIEGLVPLRPPVVAGVGTNMEGIAKDDLRESVGAASNLQGIAQAGVGTATEANTINRESVGRLLLVAQMYAELVLKPTFIMSEFLNYQYYDHVKLIRIIGPVGAKYRQLSPDEIAGGHKDVIIKISVDATENPSVQRQQFLNFYTLVQNTPPQLLPMYYKMLDKVYGMFFRGHTLDEVLPNPGPVDPDSLLTPEEERDCVLAQQSVLAKNGQDHKKYIDFHEQEYKQMERALNEPSNAMLKALYQKLIMSHWQMLQDELEKQHQAMIQQGMGQIAAEHGNMINKGQTPNASPSTQTVSAPSTASQARAIGG